jgi:hypothetical protein
MGGACVKSKRRGAFLLPPPPTPTPQTHRLGPIHPHALHSTPCKQPHTHTHQRGTPSLLLRLPWVQRWRWQWPRRRGLGSLPRALNQWRPGRPCAAAAPESRPACGAWPPLEPRTPAPPSPPGACGTRAGRWLGQPQGPRTRTLPWTRRRVGWRRRVLQRRPPRPPPDAAVRTRGQWGTVRCGSPQGEGRQGWGWLGRGLRPGVAAPRQRRRHHPPVGWWASAGRGLQRHRLAGDCWGRHPRGPEASALHGHGGCGGGGGGGGGASGVESNGEGVWGGGGGEANLARGWRGRGTGHGDCGLRSWLARAEASFGRKCAWVDAASSSHGWGGGGRGAVRAGEGAEAGEGAGEGDSSATARGVCPTWGGGRLSGTGG